MMSKDKWNMFWGNSDFPPVTKAGFNMERKAIRKMISKFVGASDSIIDFGCGEGRTLSYIREAGFANSIGIDTSDEALERCKERGFAKNKDVFNSTKSKQCRLLFSQGLLEHYEMKDWNDIITSMINTGAEYIILMQPLTKSALFRLAEYLNKKFSKFLDYVNEYDYKIVDFVNEFERYDYEVEMIKTTHNLPKFLDTSVFIVLKKERMI
jgi:SAM-dependent methyltransferase